MEFRTERLKGGILITPEEIQLISGYDKDVAQKEFDYIRQALQTGSNDLMVKQYCDFRGLDYKEVVSFINPIREHCSYPWIADDVSDEFFLKRIGF
ncbi:MAG: hypothetical protein JKY09_04120 [Crocinitomicaceae bacterium]|nr:hypothetical protein [Crocinitomicaceae bacterium]